ncbi:hypothetical protein [Streptomyces gossypiisoli]|uniref:hypothetical protein n=1 Tax=Streptomyces gossypiisoli TaxID=2748864 RepID=UPI0015DBA576|nr:hypothetical protein [Streptomyces gossypiisoli]
MADRAASSAATFALSAAGDGRGVAVQGGLGRGTPPCRAVLHRKDGQLTTLAGDGRQVGTRLGSRSDQPVPLGVPVSGRLLQLGQLGGPGVVGRLLIPRTLDTGVGTAQQFLGLDLTGERVDPLRLDDRPARRVRGRGGRVGMLGRLRRSGGGLARVVGGLVRRGGSVVRVRRGGAGGIPRLTRRGGGLSGQSLGGGRGTVGLVGVAPGGRGGARTHQPGLNGLPLTGKAFGMTIR